MDSEEKVDLQKFAPQKANRWYLLRIAVYIILLGTVLGFLYFKLKKQDAKDTKVEIHGVSIELN